MINLGEPLCIKGSFAWFLENLLCYVYIMDVIGNEKGVSQNWNFETLLFT